MSDHIHVRTCLIVVQDNKILLVPHFNTDVGPLQYNVPGGRVEFGESLQDAAVREFEEETGFTAECLALMDVYEHHRQDWHSITVAYWGAITGGTMKAEQTPWGEKIPRWFFAEELKSIKYHPIPLVDKAIVDASFEPTWMKFYSLEEILLYVQSPIPWECLSRGYVYLQGDYPWTQDTQGIIYTDCQDFERSYPNFVREHRLVDALEMGTVYEIVDVAKRQKADVTMDELVEAFNHYYRWDGFKRYET